MKHLPHLLDITQEELQEVLTLAKDMKKHPKQYENALKQKTLLMWFEKPSLRTRVSFETAMTQLGGHAIYLNKTMTHGKENLQDEIGCLNNYCDAIMARVFDQQTITKMTQHAKIPVINALSDVYHPCQALADILTVHEHIGMHAAIAYVGDGNNVCNSLIVACSKLGIPIYVSTPPNCKPDHNPTAWFEKPKDAIEKADVVYTDVWISMGEEETQEKNCLAEYQITKELLGNKLFMHCLPAIRGKEVTAEVIDGPTSIVYEQAENRLHVQKALLFMLLTKQLLIEPLQGV